MVLDQVLCRDVKIVLGDINTKAGMDNTGREEVMGQPRSQDLFPGFGAGREKTLASAGHVSILHPEILGVIN